MLSEEGHVKLADLGLAKVVSGKTYTSCGTPEYFAPEVICANGYSLSADWWTLGVLVYELMTGHAPFHSSSPSLTNQKIFQGIDLVWFPPPAQGRPEDLVKSLCKQEGAERLPMKAGGINNIKTHPFYSSLDWKAYQDHKVTPPFSPRVDGCKDLRNSRAFTSLKPAQTPETLAYIDDHSGWDQGWATMAS
jgi:serine/threonine protein kinase